MANTMTCPNLTRDAREKPDQCFLPPPSNPHQLKLLMEPVAILWDIENCPVPGDVSADDVAGNIRMALRVHPAVEGVVTMFSAYGDFNHFPRRLREGCQRTGINLIDVPNGKKDASDKAILVDMFLFALDNPPPCTILLISGDVDFAPALHKLGQRGYTVVLAIPAGIGVSLALCNAGRYVWDWPSVAKGEGFVPAKAFLARAETFTDFSGVPVGIAWQSSDDSDHLTEDEHYGYGRYAAGTMLVGGGLSHGGTPSHDLDGLTINQHHKQGNGVGTSGIVHPPPIKIQGPFFSSVPLHQTCQTCQLAKTSSVPVSSHTCRSQNLNADTVAIDDALGGSWVQPGDIEGLKSQLINLLKLNGGELVFVRVPSEYCKLYGRPLYLSEYGSPKLAHLIERMPDAFVIKGEGGRRRLYLKEGTPATQRWAIESMDLGEVSRDSACNNGSKTRRTTPPAEDDTDLVKEVILLRVWDKEEAEGQQDIREEHEASSGDEIVAEDVAANVCTYAAAVRLEVFKQELQELLVSHACRILLGSFLKLYQQRYSHDLDLSSFGVSDLDLLFEKVQDVAVVKEEQGTKRKFLIAKCRDVSQ